MLLLLCDNSLLSDTSLLTSKIAQVIQLSATNLTNLVQLDACNVRRLHWEDTLYTNSSRHLAYSETLLCALAVDFDNNTTVELDTLLRTLDNFVSYGNSVTSLELRILLLACKCFLSNFN